MSIGDKSIGGKLWFGVDWGTHSSKWVCYSDQGDTIFGQIHSSTLVRAGDSLIFSQGEEIPRGDERIDSLKGIIIKDPLGDKQA